MKFYHFIHLFIIIPLIRLFMPKKQLPPINIAAVGPS